MQPCTENVTKGGSKGFLTIIILWKWGKTTLYRHDSEYMWTNYECLSTSFVKQYSKADCDIVIAVTMATLKVHKKPSKFEFLPFIWLKTKSVPYPSYCIFRKLPKFFNFFGSMTKSYSVEFVLYDKSRFMNNKNSNCITFLQTFHYLNWHT